MELRFYVNLFHFSLKGYSPRVGYGSTQSICTYKLIYPVFHSCLPVRLIPFSCTISSLNKCKYSIYAARSSKCHQNSLNFRVLRLNSVYCHSNCLELLDPYLNMGLVNSSLTDSILNFLALCVQIATELNIGQESFFLKPHKRKYSLSYGATLLHPA